MVMAQLDKARTGSYYCNRACEQLNALFKEAEGRSDTKGMLTLNERHREALNTSHEHVATLIGWHTHE